LAAIIIPGQSGTYRHLQGRVTGLLAESGQNQLYSIQDLVYAAQGLVGGLPDQFSRMFYFNAVSATTLGFGDIVPVTTESRLLVTSEALLGVVIVGLFLNSLARRSSGNTKSPADELNKLVSLRDSGALTPEEFSRMKASIIEKQENLFVEVTTTQVTAKRNSRPGQQHGRTLYSISRATRTAVRTPATGSTGGSAG
jgi:Ion channel/Short C-terminal domain